MLLIEFSICSHFHNSKTSRKLIIVLFSLLLLSIPSCSDDDDTAHYWQRSNVNKFIPTVWCSSVGDIYAGTSSGIYLSSDNGNTWLKKSTNVDPPNYARTFCEGKDKAIYMGAFAVFRTTNKGELWKELPSNGGLEYDYINSIVIGDDSDIYVGAGNGFFISKNLGTNWTKSIAGMADTSVNTLIINSTGVIYAGTNEEGLFKSSDRGLSWVKAGIGLRTLQVDCLVISPKGFLLAGTYNGVFKSTDDGENWFATDIKSWTNTLTIDRIGYIYAGMVGRGIFRSSNDGSTWESFNSGIQNNWSVVSMAVDSSGFIYASINKEGLYRSLYANR